MNRHQLTYACNYNKVVSCIISYTIFIYHVLELYLFNLQISYIYLKEKRKDTGIKENITASAAHGWSIYCSSHACARYSAKETAFNTPNLLKKHKVEVKYCP